MLLHALSENIRPSSVDLRVGEIFRIKSAKLIDIEHSWPSEEKLQLPYIIRPGEYVLARTIEEVKQAKPKYACMLSPRSRAFRIGLNVQTNSFGPYYEGRIVFGIQNISQNPIKLSKGMSLVQISFADIKGDTKPVKHDFQRGKIL
jgi:deoxycytidine triphosphate deaminase